MKYQNKIMGVFFVLYCISALSSESGIEGEVSAKYENTDDQNDMFYFDTSFLKGSSAKNINIKRFNDDAAILPGTYRSDVYINGVMSGYDNITFVKDSSKLAKICLNKENLKKIKINYENIPENVSEILKSDQPCIDIESLLSDSSVKFDPGELRLDYSIPQIYLQDEARGYVLPEFWDKGVSAFFLGFDANLYTSRSQEKTSTSGYALINSGLNIGSWYFRHNGNYTWYESISSEYQTFNNYIQHDIEAIKGRLLIGQANTLGQLFDTVRFKGIELMSVDQMLPASRRGYAPDIRGVAQTNARVLIKQNGQLIYEKSVPPGAFQITDLYPTGYGGNLDVSVLEADGRVQNFQVPYSALNELLRPGTHKYNVVAGKLDNSAIGNPQLYQVTYQRGILNWLSANAGIQGSKNYLSEQLGLAVGGDWGSLAFGITNAHTKLSNRTLSGQSYKVSYNKYLSDTKSSLAIVANRYSSSNFMDYQTAASYLYADKNNLSFNSIDRPKNRLAITLNQAFPNGFGQAYLSGYKQDYWDGVKGSDVQYQLGYSNNYNSIFYGLSIGKTKNNNGETNTSVLFNLSMPITDEKNDYVAQLSNSITHNSNGLLGGQIGVSGTAGENSNFSYDINGLYYNKGIGESIALNGQYRSSYANFLAGYGAGKGYQNASAGVTGTLIAWSNGLVMTPYKGDTFAVIEAHGAEGAKVSNFSGIKIDSWGHAAVPYLSPYEMNEISIDPKNASSNIEFDTTTLQVAPREGAVVALQYKTQFGYPLLINTKLGLNQSLPFGADVFDDKGNSVGNVGQNGQVFARVQHEQGNLIVKWGNNHTQQCYLSYDFNPNEESNNLGLIKLDGACVS